MNRFFATLTLAALALTSCIKENDSYKELRPVQPGISIYNSTMTQDRVAMQMANAGMRVAVLAAEVAKQQAEGKDDVTVENVTCNSQKVLNALFNSYTTTIEVVEEGYKLTFNENYPMPDGFYLSGSLLVRTNGAAALADGAVWSVEIQPGFKLYADSGASRSQVNINGGTTIITDNQDGSYTIQLSNISAKVEGNSVSSSWSTGAEGFVVRPADEGVTLAYSSCAGKGFKINGSASGASIYGNMYGTGSLGLRYSVSDGLYFGTQIVSGTQVCELTSPLDYDTTVYPASEVRYVFSYNESTRKYSYKIYYNGYTYPRD